jgi:hypothetical protein
VHNVEEKMSKVILKNGMIGQVESQTSKLGPSQDLSRVC